MVSFHSKDRCAAQRELMIHRDLRGRDIRDLRVLDVMAELPRELFLPEQYRDKAYDDSPLPIGLGQTISQPYIVALMTQCLKLTGTEEVLEIGTGSGYQTAVLAKLCKKVYTIERFGDLSAQAQTVLANLGIQNIEYAVGDGSCGWPGPNCQFDRIIVTAAVPDVPQPLADQLAEGGLLAAPVGEENIQTLMVFNKAVSELHQTDICGCRFVKLIGRHGFWDE